MKSKHESVSYLVCGVPCYHCSSATCVWLAISAKDLPIWQPLIWPNNHFSPVRYTLEPKATVALNDYKFRVYEYYNPSM